MAVIFQNDLYQLDKFIEILGENKINEKDTNTKWFDEDP